MNMSGTLSVWLRILIVLLAIAAPLLVWEGYRTRVRLIQQTMMEQEAMSEERKALAAEVAAEFLTELVTGRTASVTRTERGPFTPDEPFPGLKPPSPAGEPEDRHPDFLQMLHSDERFPSSMPKRHAGALELLDAPLEAADHQRLLLVLQEIWTGADLSEDQVIYLFSRLPEELTTVGRDRFRYVERLADLPMLKVRDGTKTSLFPLSENDLSALNGRLTGLGLGLILEPADGWRGLDGVRANLDWQVRQSFDDELSQAKVAALVIGLVLEAALVLLFIAQARNARSLELQARLLAQTTHELRTPLAVIRQFGEILDGARGLSEKQYTYVRHIRRATFTMQGLVENLLAGARFERFRTKPNRQVFPLKIWLEEVVARMELVGDHPLEVVSCPQVEVDWDGEQMERVLVNLIDNAFKHARTRVVLSLRLEQDDLVLSVRDYGPETRTIPRIGRFRRGGHNDSGLGLGLYLCREIVRVHGGSLSFHLQAPGLEAVVRLPIRDNVKEGEDHGAA